MKAMKKILESSAEMQKQQKVLLKKQIELDKNQSK